MIERRKKIMMKKPIMEKAKEVHLRWEERREGEKGGGKVRQIRSRVASRRRMRRDHGVGRDLPRCTSQSEEKNDAMSRPRNGGNKNSLSSSNPLE